MSVVVTLTCTSDSHFQEEVRNIFFEKQESYKDNLGANVLAKQWHSQSLLPLNDLAENGQQISFGDGIT